MYSVNWVDIEKFGKSVLTLSSVLYHLDFFLFSSSNGILFSAFEKFPFVLKIGNDMIFIFLLCLQLTHSSVLSFPGHLHLNLFSPF